MDFDDYTIPVPHHWTSEDALHVVQFLNDIVQAIWTLHGDGMNEILRCPSARYDDPSPWPAVEPRPKNDLPF